MAPARPRPVAHGGAARYLPQSGRGRSSTTIAMGAGMMPIALGLGVDPGFRSPMAIVVIGGLITSRPSLSLLVIPVIFTYVDDVVLKDQRLAAPQAAAGGPGAPPRRGQPTGTEEGQGKNMSLADASKHRPPPRQAPASSCCTAWAPTTTTSCRWRGSWRAVGRWAACASSSPRADAAGDAERRPRDARLVRHPRHAGGAPGRNRAARIAAADRRG